MVLISLLLFLLSVLTDDMFRQLLDSPELSSASSLSWICLFGVRSLPELCLSVNRHAVIDEWRASAHRYIDGISGVVVWNLSALGLLWQLLCLQKAGNSLCTLSQLINQCVSLCRFQTSQWERIRYLDRYQSKCGTWVQCSPSWWEEFYHLEQCLSSCSLSWRQSGDISSITSLASYLLSSSFSFSPVLKSPSSCAISNSAVR